MSALTTHRANQLWLTKRGLYFFVLWLPTLVPLIGLGISVHLPFALVHALKARGTPTGQLLAKSWLVPLKVAAWAAVETACLFAWTKVFGRAVPGRSIWSLTTAQHTWTAFAFYVGVSFGVAVAYVCLGQFALFTFAARWPVDRSSSEASKP